MSSSDLPFTSLTGHCTCRAISYTILAPPLITNCCHCTYCQRSSGSAFALNSLIECYNFALTPKSTVSPIVTGIPSLSSPFGANHLVAHCPACHTALYAHYRANRSLLFVKAGTLDDESRKRVRPDVHIMTGTKMAWVDLGGERERGVGVYEGYYDHKEVWSKESLERREVLGNWVEEGGLGREGEGKVSSG